MDCKPASFLLFGLRRDAYEFAAEFASSEFVRWAAPAYGPHQAVAYVEADDPVALARWIESLRATPGIAELDARAVKALPEDRIFGSVETCAPERAVLLIGVDYREEKERVVTLRLREIPGVVLARAMWGPADIIAIVQAEDHEALRNLICDRVKTLPGVRSNTTLYCYVDPH